MSVLYRYENTKIYDGESNLEKMQIIDSDIGII